MNRLFLSLFFFISMHVTAFAQDNSNRLGLDNTVGYRLQYLLKDIWGPIFLLVVFAMIVVGIYFLIKGITLLVELSRGQRVSAKQPLTYLIIAGLLMALPELAGVGMTSLLGNARGTSALGAGELDIMTMDQTNGGNYLDKMMGNFGNVKAVNNCLTSSTPAECMAGNIANNVAPIATYFLFAIVFVMGFIMLSTTLLKMTRVSDGQEKSTGLIGQLIFAFLLMNSPFLFYYISNSMLGISEHTITNSGFINESSGYLRYNYQTSNEVLKKYLGLIGYAFVILSFFGAFAFVRGLFMMNAVAQGRSQGGSMAMGATYSIAGILLANAKVSTCYVLTTFMGDGGGFCAG